MNPEQESDFIGIKNSIFPLQDGLIKLENRVKELERPEKSVKTILQILGEIDLRVKNLEDARRRQIQLNQELLEKKTPSPVKSFWDRFKK